MLKLFWFFVGPLQQFFYFFDKYLFFKFISECQKEILMCTPPSSHVCDFSPKDSPGKIVENAFYFINKAFFVLKIIKFLYFAFANFFPSVSHCLKK